MPNRSTFPKEKKETSERPTLGLRVSEEAFVACALPLEQIRGVHAVDVIVEKRPQFHSVCDAEEHAVSVEITVAVRQRDAVGFAQRLNG